MRRFPAVLTVVLVVLSTAGGRASRQVGAAAPAAQSPGAQANANIAPTTTGTGAISGVAVDDTTGGPVAGVVVYLGPPNRGPQGQPIRQITDAKGRFVFAHLPAWDGYFINASRFGYFDGHYGRSTSGQLGARIAVGEGQWVRDIRVLMSRASTMTGTVLDEQNQPVVGAYVRVIRQITIASGPQLAAGVVATTDDRGVYRIAGLQAGKYFVELPSVQHSVPSGTPMATLAGQSPQMAANGESVGRPPSFTDPIVDADAQNQIILNKYPLPPRSRDGRPMVYPPTFYPGATTIAGATPIALTAGEDRVGIDLRLVAVPASRITGTVDGPPDARANLMLRLMLPGTEDLGEGSEAATALVGVDGHFTFLNVPAGSYVIDTNQSLTEYQNSNVIGPSRTLPQTPGFISTGLGSFGVFSGVEGVSMTYKHSPLTDEYSARQRVSVEGHDLTDVVVTMRKGGTISGRLVWEGQRVSDLSGRLTAQPARGTASLGVVRSQSDTATPDRFTIAGLRGGEYLVVSSADRVKSIICGGRDYTYLPVDMSSGADITDCVVTFTDKSTVVSGTVSDAGGVPAADSGVIVFPVEREQWGVYGFSPVRTKALSTTNTGGYRFQSLPEGDYYFIAVPGELVNAWQDPKFLEVAAVQATRVHLAWGDKVTQNLTVKPIKWDSKEPEF